MTSREAPSDLDYYEQFNCTDPDPFTEMCDCGHYEAEDRITLSRDHKTYCGHCAMNIADIDPEFPPMSSGVDAFAVLRRSLNKATAAAVQPKEAA